MRPVASCCASLRIHSSRSDRIPKISGYNSRNAAYWAFTRQDASVSPSFITASQHMSDEQQKITVENQKFIELRAKGWTYARISAEIGVTKRSLVDWSRKFQFEIQNLRALELEALQAEWIATREDRIRALGEQLRAVETELKTRDFSQVPTGRLFTLAAALRREILHDTATVKLSSPVDAIPNDEYHEQVQDWQG